MKYTFKQFTQYAALSEEERTQENFDKIFPETLDEGIIDDIAQKAGEVVGKAAKAVGIKSELEKSKEKLKAAQEKRAADKKAMDAKVKKAKSASFDAKAEALKKQIGSASAAIEKDRAALKRATGGRYSDSQFAKDLIAQQNESFIEVLNAVVEGYINIEEFIAEAKAAKTATVYEITKKKNGKESKQTGTLEELIDDYSYTLETGQSYERERGNKKINLEPKTIKALVDNLSKAVDNAAANGYSGVSFSYKEVTPKEIKESVQATENNSVAEFLEALRDEVMEEFNLSEDQVKTIDGLVVDKVDVLLRESAETESLRKAANKIAKELKSLELSNGFVSNGANVARKLVRDDITQPYKFAVATFKSPSFPNFEIFVNASFANDDTSGDIKYNLTVRQTTKKAGGTSSSVIKQIKDVASSKIHTSVKSLIKFIEKQD